MKELLRRTRKISPREKLKIEQELKKIEVAQKSIDDQVTAKV